MNSKTMLNFIDGEWRQASSTDCQDIVNPATQDLLGYVPFSTAQDISAAVDAASQALPDWRRVPPTEHVQYLFALKTLLEKHRQELARLITMECGKTLDESLGELQRAIENVEMACGIPALLQGRISEDIAPGIDELMLQQPLGVCAGITPFNFPGMIPFWFLPYALACGNTYVLKPSERVPMTMQRILQLIEEIYLPKGVLNLVNGGKEAVDALLDHPAVRAVSFVGSTQVARYIYSRASANGKRAQCQGGAKNPVVIMPDADLEMTTRIVADSAFGCAGQRCLAASLAITVGEVGPAFSEAISTAARERAVGYGLEPDVQMGPVITPESKARIIKLISQTNNGSGHILVDGREAQIPGYERGNFLTLPSLMMCPLIANLAEQKSSDRCSA